MANNTYSHNYPSGLLTMRLNTIYNHALHLAGLPSYYYVMLRHAVPPLFVIEFLHRIVDVFMEYFGECSETKIKENYVTVYEV